jgi:hypothetical protein
MTEPRDVMLPAEAASSIDQILGIVLDSFMGGSPTAHVGAFGWGFDVERVVDLEQRLRDVWNAEELSRGEGDERSIELSMEDVALILHGMAFTEVMSADLPWIDMVRWTSDFVTTQLRAPWTEDEWEAFGATGG